ncbi:MAG TPA: MBL fold metallo-hydrolase [Chryseosolibacter sp.]|nr:MBL fold metallo-hydrolase [Chryseosolibacter sp.]
MSLFIASLNSGSNGNCYYIGNQEEAILIDGGISCRETEKRLKRIGLSIKNVKAIFISHEHGDHIHGVSSISKKFQIPVYLSPLTQANARVELSDKLIFHFKAHEPVSIGNLTIHPFQKNHDASDPHSFTVANESVTIGIFTDIGVVCENVKRYFSQCHAAFLESNYDDEMLERGSYPYFLKERIRGNKGHLSNAQALELFQQHRAPFMSHLFLSHLSRDNNSPKLVKNLFTKVAGRTQIFVASRDRQSQLYHIRNVNRFRKAARTANSGQVKFQLGLFQ